MYLCHETGDRNSSAFLIMHISENIQVSGKREDRYNTQNLSIQFYIQIRALVSETL